MQRRFRFSVDSSVSASALSEHVRRAELAVRASRGNHSHDLAYGRDAGKVTLVVDAYGDASGDASGGAGMVFVRILVAYLLAYHSKQAFTLRRLPLSDQRKPETEAA